MDIKIKMNRLKDIQPQLLGKMRRIVALQKKLRYFYLFNKGLDFIGEIK